MANAILKTSWTPSMHIVSTWCKMKPIEELQEMIERSMLHGTYHTLQLPDRPIQLPMNICARVHKLHYRFYGYSRSSTMKVSWKTFSDLLPRIPKICLKRNMKYMINYRQLCSAFVQMDVGKAKAFAKGFKRCSRFLWLDKKAINGNILCIA